MAHPHPHLPATCSPRLARLGQTLEPLLPGMTVLGLSRVSRSDSSCLFLQGKITNEKGLMQCWINWQVTSQKRLMTGLGRISPRVRRKGSSWRSTSRPRSRRRKARILAGKVTRVGRAPPPRPPSQSRATHPILTSLTTHSSIHCCSILQNVIKSKRWDTEFKIFSA